MCSRVQGGKPETRLWNKSLDSTIKHQKYLTQYSMRILDLKYTVYHFSGFWVVLWWWCTDRLLDIGTKPITEWENQGFTGFIKIIFCSVPVGKLAAGMVYYFLFGLHLMIPMDLSPLPMHCQHCIICHFGSEIQKTMYVVCVTRFLFL